jgi:hypothetical protein
MTTEFCLRCFSCAIDFVCERVVRDSDTLGLTSRSGGHSAFRPCGLDCLLHSEPL